MSDINSVDYAKTLAENRESSRRMAKEVREGAETDKARLAKNYESQQKKNQENYLESLGKKEQDYKNNIDRVSANTKEIIDHSKKKFTKQLSEERGRFDQDAAQNRDKIQRNLENLSSSYKKSLDNQIESNQNTQDGQSRDFGKAKTSQRDNYEGILSGVVNKNKEMLGEFREKQYLDKKNLQDGHESRMHELRKNESGKRIQDVSVKQKQIEDLKRAGDKEKEILLENQERVNSDRKDSFSRTVSDQTEYFNNLSNDLQKSSAFEKNLSKKEFDQQRIDDNQAHHLEAEALKKKIREAVDHEKKVEMGFKEGSSEERRLGRVIKNYKHELGQVKQDKQMEGNLVRNQGLEELKKVKYQSAMELDELKNMSHLEHQKNQEIQNEEQERLSGQFNNTRAQDMQLFTDKSESLQRKGREGMEKQSERWAKKVDDLSKDNQEAIHSLKEFFGEKNKVIGRKQEKEKNELIKGMSRGFEDKLTKTASSFEDKLQFQQKMDNEVKDGLEAKLKKFYGQRQRDIQYQDQITAERLAEQEEVKKDSLSLQEQKFTRRLEEIRQDYENRIKDIYDLQEKKVKTIVGVNEDKLEKFNSEFLRTIQKIQSANKRESMNLKQGHEITLSNVKLVYEDKIQKMKDDFEHRTEKLKERRD